MTRLLLPAVRVLAAVSLYATLASCQGEAHGDVATTDSQDTTATPAATSTAAATSAAAAPGAAAEEPQAQVIGYGEPVDLKAFLVPGQITLFDFMSEYCGPCRAFAPYLERLNAERDDLTVVKVDINRRGKRGIDWGSPLARQYGVHSVPHFKVYGADGNLMVEGRDAQPLVISWIENLAPRRPQ